LEVRKRRKTAVLKFGGQKEKQKSCVIGGQKEKQNGCVIGGQKGKQNSCVKVWRSEREAKMLLAVGKRSKTDVTGGQKGKQNSCVKVEIKSSLVFNYGIKGWRYSCIILDLDTG
jgi:hypothetical protein